MEPLYLIGVAVLAVFGLVFAIILFNFFGIWLRARIANAPVGMGKMIGMRLRRVPVGLIVDNQTNRHASKAHPDHFAHADRRIGDARPEPDPEKVEKNDRE